METDLNGSSEFQELTPVQKVNALRRLFEHAPTEFTEGNSPGIPAEIRHPEQIVGMWLGKNIPDMNFPPQRGQIIRFLYLNPGKKSPSGILVDISRNNRFFGSMVHLGFNIDSVQMKKDGGVVLDCAKLKGFQTPLPV